MDSTQITAYSAIVLSAATVVIGVINHKRIRSNCCKKELEVSLDIESTTPPSTYQPPAK